MEINYFLQTTMIFFLWILNNFSWNKMLEKNGGELWLTARNPDHPEAAAQRCLENKLFLKNWQNSQEIICTGVSF